MYKILQRSNGDSLNEFYAWTPIHLKHGNRAWLQSIPYQGEDRAWMSDTYIAGEVPGDSQKEPEAQNCSGISSALSPAQGWHRQGSHRVIEKILNPLVWMEQEEILTRDGVSDCHQSRLWSYTTLDHVSRQWQLINRMGVLTTLLQHTESLGWKLQWTEITRQYKLLPRTILHMIKPK